MGKNYYKIDKDAILDPTPALPASYLKTHSNSSITVSKNVLKQWIKS